MKNIQEFFQYGLDRDLPPLWRPHEGITIELGPGKKEKIITDIKLGANLPDGYIAHFDVKNGKDWELANRRPLLLKWIAPQRIPCPDESISAIYAAQFFEHLNGDDAVATLRECQRVLRRGGVLNMVVPYYNSAHMAQALDHKSFWSEETWHWLFDNAYYDDHQFDWQLRVHICFIMGIVERNLDLFTQLVKE